MPKRIADFEEKARCIIEVIKRGGDRLDYNSLFSQVKDLGIWRRNPEAIPTALAGMAKEEILVFIDKNGRDITKSILELPDDKKRKKIRTENVKLQLNLESKFVEETVKKLGIFEIPKYINKDLYDFIASGEVLASRFGSIAVMWRKAIIVEVTGYRIWMCIRRNSKKEIRFFYVHNGERLPIPRLADLVEKNLRFVELSEKSFDHLLNNACVHFYCGIPYNSGFIMSSAIAVLLTVGIRYLKDGHYFKEAVRENKCITSKHFQKFFDKREMLYDAITIADNMYLREKQPIPSTSSTSAEYLLLFGTTKPATVFCYRNRSETSEIINPEIYAYYFPKPLFTNIWTGTGHDFLEILRSIRKRSEYIPDAENFFSKVADDLHTSIWKYGKVGLDLLQKGLVEDEVEKVVKGFSLLKVAIYEQICNSLRFTYKYFSYPHIANLTQILGQHGKFGSPVGVGGFFQLLNENFREDRNFAELLLGVCRDWCIHHGGRVVMSLPYILQEKDNRLFWGIVVHKAS